MKGDMTLIPMDKSGLKFADWSVIITHCFSLHEVMYLMIYGKFYEKFLLDILFSQAQWNIQPNHLNSLRPSLHC